jgi:hypothetical protein
MAGQATTLSPAAWSTQAGVVGRVRRVLDASRHARPSASRWRLAVAVAVVALCAGEASRVLALQDATDRIVASTPIGGTLTEAVTAEAFGGIARGAALEVAAVPSENVSAALASRSGVVLTPTSASAGHASASTDDRAPAAGSIASIANAEPASVGVAASDVDFGASTSVLPAVQHALAPRSGDDGGPLGSATPQTGFAPLDLSASLDDLLLDDDVDQEMARPTLDQPSHNGGAVNVRAARPRTRGTGFFAKVGRSLAHILGTHTRSPGGVPEPRRRRA